MMKRTFVCLLIIGLAGFIFAAGDLLIPQENVLFDATGRSAAFAQLVTSDNYKFWAGRGILGVLMEMVGTIGLYLYLMSTKAERLAFAGLLLTLTHQMLGLGVFAVVLFMFPALGELHLNGHQGVLQYAKVDGTLLGIFLLLSLIATLAGLFMMALAVQRSGCLPKYSGWMAFIGFALIPLPGMLLQVFANMIWGLAYCWMAFHIAKCGLSKHQGAELNVTSVA